MPLVAFGLNSTRTLNVLIGLLLLASAIHFADNAVRLDLYPGPRWFTPWAVISAWFALPALAWLAVRTQSKVLLTIFAASGCLGFEHYLVTPMCGVAWRCNATILFEAGASLLLLAYIFTPRQRTA